MKAKEVIYGLLAFMGLILASCEPFGWINIVGFTLFASIAGGAIIHQERQKKEGGSHENN